MTRYWKCVALLALAGVAGSGEPGSGGIYGPRLEEVGKLGIGPAFDAVVDGNTLYVIGGGTLYVADLANPKAPKVVSKLGGFGHVRQLIVRDGIAYITAREDSFFLVDVSKREKPTLLSHYDSIELATGLSLSGNIAFIANRHAGVELIDVTNPRRPEHLSTIRVGEAQSLAAHDGYIYVGVWRTQELVVVDARNPRKPVQIASAPLTGYGDGVAVRGNIAYVSTGHHSSTPSVPYPKPGEPGYGSGHGLEIFDISNPAKPRFLSRLKTPPFYNLYMDTWRVRLAKNYAYMNDTYNGVFVVDIADPQKPKFLAHHQLPVVPGIGDGGMPVDAKPGPAVGLGVGKDYLYVAGSWSDLHVIAAPGLAIPLDPPAVSKWTIPKRETAAADPRYRLYMSEGQVYSAIPWYKEADGTNVALVAAGSAGIEAVRVGPRPQRVASFRTEGIAYDATPHGDKVYVAEGMGGLTIWQRGSDKKLTRVGQLRFGDHSVQQATVAPDGRHVLLHVGPNLLKIVDVSNAATPKLVLEDLHIGLFYKRPFAINFAENRHAMVMWTVTGLYQFDMTGTPKFTGWSYPHRFAPENGSTADGKNWITTTVSGKYVVLEPGETRPTEELPAYGVEGYDLRGKPSLFGNTLFTANALTGRVTAVDVTDRKRPMLLSTMLLPEHPGYVVGMDDGQALIPGGYQGLLVWSFRK
ncbi:MAG: hypothetical protein SGI92_02425 [Bryobacteraceae bacterium]|nr:hypothetical protein [Bryobacteraceae bacterium]